VLSWEGTVIHFDHEYVEGQLADTLAALPQQAPDKPPRPKRGSRAALIEALTHELGEHLRSARDYAVATEDRTGTPQLLPRPKQELLARKLNVDKSSVSRCLSDRSARELRFLWDVAGDVDRILEHAGRQC
jgi:hypothetical protein